jgi:hypothetical protein
MVVRCRSNTKSIKSERDFLGWVYRHTIGETRLESASPIFYNKFTKNKMKIDKNYYRFDLYNVTFDNKYYHQHIIIYVAGNSLEDACTPN